MTVSRRLACLSLFLTAGSCLVAWPTNTGSGSQGSSSSGMHPGGQASSTPQVDPQVNPSMVPRAGNPVPAGNHGPAAMPGMSPKFDTAALPTDVKTMIVQFSTLRDKLMADRQALIAKLKGVSDAQRKQIIADFLTSEKSLLDQQKALAKQIRDEVRSLRRSAQPGPT